MKNGIALRAILIAWLVAGCLDISSAFVIWTTKGVSLSRGLQGIAVGLLGRNPSHQGGWPAITLGLALHFVIMFGVVLVFYLASCSFSVLLRRPVLSGIIYGPIVYLIMYWIVVPLSRIGPRPHSLGNDLTAILIHICLIGLPIALIVSFFSQPKVEPNL